MRDERGKIASHVAAAPIPTPLSSDLYSCMAFEYIKFRWGRDIFFLGLSRLYVNTICPFAMMVSFDGKNGWYAVQHSLVFGTLRLYNMLFFVVIWGRNRSTFQFAVDFEKMDLSFWLRKSLMWLIRQSCLIEDIDVSQQHNRELAEVSQISFEVDKHSKHDST